MLGDPAAAGHRPVLVLGHPAAAHDRAFLVLGDPAAAGHRPVLVLGHPAAAQHRTGALGQRERVVGVDPGQAVGQAGQARVPALRGRTVG